MRDENTYRDVSGLMISIICYVFPGLFPLFMAKSQHPSSPSDNTRHHKKTNSNPHLFAYPYYSYPYLILLLLFKNKKADLFRSRLSTRQKIQQLIPRPRSEPTNPGEPDNTCHRARFSAPFYLFILFIFLPFWFNFITLIPFKKNTSDLILMDV